MKINWGTAIVVAFVGFISFIMYFVISMSTDKKFDHDLVTEDYYQQELKYQDDINKVENAKKLKVAIDLIEDKEVAKLLNYSKGKLTELKTSNDRETNNK